MDFVENPRSERGKRKDKPQKIIKEKEEKEEVELSKTTSSFLKGNLHKGNGRLFKSLQLSETEWKRKKKRSTKKNN